MNVLDIRVTDTLLRELLRTETAPLATPAARLAKGVDRIEQLLTSVGFHETAQALGKLRTEFEEATRAPEIPAVTSDAEDPLTGRRKRKRNLVATGDGVMEVKG